MMRAMHLGHFARIATVSVAATLAMPVPAAASDRKVRRFDKMGKAAFRQGRLDDAIAAFEAAYDTDGDPKFLFNVGKCHQKKGDLDLAIYYIDRYLTEAPDAKDASDVQALIELLGRKLRKTHGEIAVESSPDGALVELEGDDDTVEGVTPYAGWLPFGTYELRVSLADHRTETLTVVVRPDESVEESVILVEGRESAGGGRCRHGALGEQGTRGSGHVGGRLPERRRLPPAVPGRG